MIRRRGAVWAVLLVGALAAPAQGQIAWETPMLIGPGAPGGFGAYLMEPWPGNGIGVMGTYRTSPVPVGLGFRVGLGEGIGEDALLSFPLGMSFGVNLESEGITFRPYVAPRVVLDAVLGDEDPPQGNDDDLDLDVAADLGLDLAFDPAWTIRFAASIGDHRDGLLIGVAFPH